MNPKPKIKANCRVKTLVDVGPRLPVGSVGVVVRVDEDEYPYVVAFTHLHNGKTKLPVEGIDPQSGPMQNTVPFKANEVEFLDDLSITQGSN